MFFYHSNRVDNFSVTTRTCIMSVNNSIFLISKSIIDKTPFVYNNCLVSEVKIATFVDQDNRKNFNLWFLGLLKNQFYCILSPHFWRTILAKTLCLSQNSGNRQLFSLTIGDLNLCGKKPILVTQVQVAVLWRDMSLPFKRKRTFTLSFLRRR